MKTKTHILNVSAKVNLFDYHNCFFAINNREDLEKLEELESLQNQVQEVRLQDKLREQKYYQNLEKLYEPLTDTIKNTSENLTKAITENYINNNKAIENLNEKVLELMNDKGTIATYLASSVVNLFKSERKVNLD